MKLFLVIYFIGEIVGVAGPLPYGMDECKSRAALINAEWDENWSKKDLAHSRVMVIGGYRIERKDFTLACELHDARPALVEHLPNF